MDAALANIRRALIEALIFLCSPTEQLDQQGPADVEQLMQDRIHFRIVIQLQAGNVAQAGSQAARQQEEER